MFFCCVCNNLQAQKAGIKGTVTDTSGTKTLQYAIIALLDKKDSTLVTSSRSFLNGDFNIEKLKPGNYTVMISYPAMADFILDVSLKDTGALNIGKIIMTSRFHLLQEVIVKSGKAIWMKGDTLEFRADSFPVGQGANVEELLRRLPGIEVGPDGKIKAQGQDVAKVLVDGDEFFNDDPTLATRYLQAKSVDKVQVFDKKSDQATFSGIDDGVRSKTINIKLKENSKNGYFGKASVATDTKDFYNDDAMFNLFRGKEKISVFAIGSNTGTTGLSYQDRDQYLSSSNNLVEDESGRLIGGNFENSDSYYGGGQPTSFYAGAQYANKWNSNKRNLNFNYRFNQLHTQGWQKSTNTELLPDSSIRQNNGSSSNASYSEQHKAGGYYEIVLDSFSTVKMMVQGQKQSSTGANESSWESLNGVGKFLNKSTQLNQTDGNSDQFSSSVQWQRRFRKQGRTFSLVLLQNYGNNESTKRTEALSFYYDSLNPNPSGDSLNQQQLNKNRTTSEAARAVYTELISKNLYLSTEYSWRITNTEKDRNVMNRDAAGKYDVHIDSLSNNYAYKVISHLPGLTLQYSPKKITASVGGKLGYTTLEQTNLDNHNNSKRHFVNLFPQALVSFNLSQMSHFSLNYSGRTQQPTIEQLQPLLENSNPLAVTIGNPNLQPSFSHNMSLSYFGYNMTKASSINFSLNWSEIKNAITNSQVIDQFNKSTFQFVNRDGPPMLSAYASFSRRVNKAGKKLNLNIGLNIRGSKSGFIRVLNNTDVRSDQASFSFGPSFTLYKSKVMSLNGRSSFSYSESKSNIGNIGATHTWSYNHSGGATIYLPWKIEFSTDIDMNFQPANSSFNTSRQVIKWNASLVKKFLKNGQGQVKFEAFDILNQNTGYYRSSNGNSFSESSNNYIPRYALLSVTWNFTHTIQK